MAPGPKVAEAIARAEGNAGEKAPLYEYLLADIKSLSAPATAVDDLNAVADSFFRQALGVVSTRAVLAAFVAMLKTLQNSDLCIEVGTHALSLLAAQPSSFADARRRPGRARRLRPREQRGVSGRGQGAGRDSAG